MIQRLACKTPDRLAMRGTAGEHQRRLGRRMRAKHRKHVALIVMTEMKETVPRQDAGEIPLQGKPAHVGDDQFVCRKMSPTGIDHGRRSIDTSEGGTNID